MTSKPVLSVCLSALLLASCTSEPTEQQLSGLDGLPPATGGLSGRADMPIAQPGQSLPLETTRSASFTTNTGTMMSLDVSPDGETIVFDMLGDIYLLDRQGGKARPIRTGLAYDSQPVFSPDGEHIAFLSDYSGAENVWIMDREGGSPFQLSFHDDFTIFSSPEWSPNGATITLSRFWEGENAYELLSFPTDRASLGSTLVPLRPEGSPDSDATSTLGAVFSPSGDQICFEMLSGGSPAFDHLPPWKIGCMDRETSEIEQLDLPDTDTGIPVVRPMLSPDGAQIAYVERRAGETRLMLFDRASQTSRFLTTLDPDSLQASLWHDAVARYDFTPDGESLILSLNGGIAEIDLADGTIQQLPFEVDVDLPLGPLARTQIPLETGPVEARLIQWPALSPDGASVAFSALGRIYVAGSDTDARLDTSLTGEAQNTHHPAWTVDGHSLIYTSWDKQDGGTIWRIDPDAGEKVQLSKQPAFYTHPVPTSDGEAIFVVRSPVEARNDTYMEYGQLRQAELVRMSIEGGSSQVLYSGRIGGKPVIASDGGSVFINSDAGVLSINLKDGASTLLTQALGPGWYFQPSAVPADDIRVSPDGRWAIAQIIEQLFLYPVVPGEIVDLMRDSRVVPLTRVGGDFAGWSDDSSTLYWSIGSSLYEIALSDLQDGHDRAEDQTQPIKLTVVRERAKPEGLKLLRGATVYPMDERSETGHRIENADILIDGARILEIGPSGSLNGDNAEIVDVSGAFILPGFIDAHYHLADIRRDVLQRDVWGLKTNLAYGVTTLFDPSSLSIDMLAYQDMVEAGDVTGSRLFSTGPAIFSFNDFRSPDDVRHVLERYKEHYRLNNLKQYRSGNRRVRQWFVEEANKLGMTPTTEGALSFKLGLSHIMDGYSGNEHALPPPALYDDVAQLFAQSETTGTLTLMITHGGTPADMVFHDRMTDAERARYEALVPEYFTGMRFGGRAVLPQEEYLYEEIAASAHRIFEAGGIMGVGAHGDVPGLGTHWEMAAYVEGGWAASDALWAGTMGSAIAIGRDASLGSLEPGKYADLVVLNSDPLADIHNSMDVRMVMVNGDIHRPASTPSNQNKN